MTFSGPDTIIGSEPAAFERTLKYYVTKKENVFVIMGDNMV